METSAAASRRTLRSNEYTVGLITALSKESIAVTAILDEEHDEPFDYEIPEDDYNNYGWGRIHQHNVVVVSFPMNSPGKVTAAVVARLMVTAFPSIRMGLMVGIGGGVPGEPRPDIRLGDIVVSAPVGTTFGVVQYDLGKEEERGGKERFRRTGALSEPPRALLTAVGKLKEQRRLHGTNVSRIIAETLEKYPQLEEEDEDDSSYRYPGFENDVLFCADSTTTIERKKRPKDEPRIHYGLIASGDSVIKNAQKRDEIAGRLKEDTDAACLCFEMEAAGLMNNFPCLVVRGICDYSDSHKNDVWQNYSALAAAAYAKEVLRVLQAARVKSTKDAREVMGEVQQHVQEIQSTVSKLEEENLMKQIHTWLDPADPSVNYNEARKARHRQTNDWFLKHHAYGLWKQRQYFNLWLHGVSGCGKTVLASTIVDSLSEQCLYFFFDFQEKKMQNLDQALRSLIIQLYNREYKSRTALQRLYRSLFAGSAQPSTEELRQTFDEMVLDTGGVRIILDALDESRECERDELLGWLREKMPASVPVCRPAADHGRIQFIITCRSDQQDIESELSDFIPRRLTIHITEDLVKEDINRFVTEKLREHPWFKTWGQPEHKGVRTKIEESLTQTAHAMFRWASLQLNYSLGQCGSVKALEETLTKLPKDLNDVYARSLEIVPDQHKKDANRLLLLVLSSDEPLTAAAALEAVPIIAALEPLESDRDLPGISINRDGVMQDLRAFSSILSSLIQKRPGWRTTKPCLQLAHASVKDFLLSTWFESFSQSQFNLSGSETLGKRSMVRACLACLEWVSPWSPSTKDDRRFPFLEHAVDNWMNYAELQGGSNAARKDVLQFLEPKNRSRQLWASLWFSKPDYSGSPLYWASQLGLVSIVKYLLDGGVDINLAGGWYGCALSAACSRGKGAVAQMLLERGADVNATGGMLGTVLQVASYYGHSKIIDMLLDHGADVTACGGDYETALQAASCPFGNTGVVQKLLERGANVNAEGGIFGSALQAACAWGQDEIVKALLAAGAFVKATGGRHGNALQAACHFRKGRIVRMLYKSGADATMLTDRDSVRFFSWIVEHHEQERRRLISRHFQAPLHPTNYQEPPSSSRQREKWSDDPNRTVSFVVESTNTVGQTVPQPPQSNYPNRAAFFVAESTNTVEQRVLRPQAQSHHAIPAFAPTGTSWSSHRPTGQIGPRTDWGIHCAVFKPSWNAA